jgi:hypothetical protein
LRARQVVAGIQECLNAQLGCVPTLDLVVTAICDIGGVGLAVVSWKLLERRAEDLCRRWQGCCDAVSADGSLQPTQKRRHALPVCAKRCRAEKSDHRHHRRKRPHDGRTAERGYKLPSSNADRHSTPRQWDHDPLQCGERYHAPIGRSATNFAVVLRTKLAVFQRRGNSVAFGLMRTSGSVL